MRSLFLVLSLIAAPAQDAAPPTAANKLPEPSAEEVREAQKGLRDLFKKEYAQTSKSARQALAAQFLQFGRSRDEKPVTRYMVLKEAIDLSLLADDAATALAAADEIVRNFAVNGVALREEVLSRIKVSSGASEAAKAVGLAYADLIQEAMDADAVDDAARAVPKAQAAARASKDVSLQERVEALSKELADLREEAGPVARHRATLKENPADPEANLGYGAFLCLVKGDWEKGLPLLAKGSDDRLRGAAEKDLAAPTDPREQAAAGDAWADLSAGERKPLRKAHLVARAGHWYRAAIPKLDGFSRLKVQARLDEWEKSAAKVKVRAGGGPVVDLLSWIDPAECSVLPQSRWTLRNRVLVSPPNNPDLKFSLLQVPCAPPAEYDLTVAMQRTEGEGPFCVGLVAGGRQFVVVQHGPEGKLSAALFGGEDSSDIASKFPSDKVAGKGAPLPEGKPGVIVCSVRARQLQVSLNGQMVIDWKNPPWAEASCPAGMEVPVRQALFLAVRDNTTFEVSQLLLKPVSGGAPRRVAVPKAPAGPPQGPPKPPPPPPR
jgi:hypothetical protein